MSSAGAFISKHEDALFPGPSSNWLRTIRHDGIPGRTGSRDLNSKMALVTVSLVRYFLLGFLAVALVGFSGTLTAQDFTVFGGFQHPGTITTVSSGVGVASSAARQAVDTKNFGVFGARLYRSAAPVGLEHTVAYSPNFIDSNGHAFLYSANMRVELPVPRLRPYATGGVGFFHAGGDGPASFGTKFSFNYGGGLKVGLIEPVGLRFDVRLYSIRGIEDRTLNVLEPSIGIFVEF